MNQAPAFQRLACNPSFLFRRSPTLAAFYSPPNMQSFLTFHKLGTLAAGRIHPLLLLLNPFFSFLLFILISHIRGPLSNIFFHIFFIFFLDRILAPCRAHPPHACGLVTLRACALSNIHEPRPAPLGAGLLFFQASVAIRLSSVFQVKPIHLET